MMKKCVDAGGNVVSVEDQGTIDIWKRKGIIKKVFADDVKGITDKGGVLVLCSDGIIDACCFHKALIHETSNPFRIFGGPLIFSPSYKDFDPVYAEKSIENIKKGMRRKNTNSLFIDFHAPCGMMMDLMQSIEEIPLMAEEAIEFLGLYFPDKSKIHSFLHTRRNNEGKIEQNTYRLIA